MQIKIWWPLLFVATIVTASILVFPADLRLADLLGKSGRTQEAIETYSRLLQKQPGRNDVRMQLSKLYIQEGDYENAVEQVEKIDDEYLIDAYTLNQIADIYSQLGNKNKTISTLEKVIDISPENPEYRRKLAEAYEWNLDSPKALDIYQSLIDESPNDVPTLKKLVTLTLAANDRVKAKLYLRRLLSQRPADLASRKRLGDIYIDADQKELATEEYERVLKATPDDNPLRARLADLYLWMQNYDHTVSHLEYLVSHNPLNDRYFDKLMKLTRETEPEKAINYLKFRISHTPQQYELYERLYHLYVHVGYTDEAIEQLQAIVKRHEDEPIWQAKLAQLYHDTMQPEQSTATLQTLLQHETYQQEAATKLRHYYQDRKKLDALASLYAELKEQNALRVAWRAEYADLLVRTHHNDEAIDEYQELLNRRPTDAATRIRLANLYLHQGESKKARRLIKNGREKYHAEDRRFLLYAASFFEKQGLPEESISAYEYLAGLSPDSKKFTMPLIALYLKTGHPEKAHALYDELIAHEPGNIDLKLEVANLHWRQRDFDGMHQQIWKISKLEPPPANIHKKIGAFYFDRSFYGLAAKHLENVDQSATPDSLTLQHLALSLAWSNQWDKARSAYVRHHENFPNDYFSHYHFGSLLAGLGESEAAEQQFKTALRLTRQQPDDRQINEVRAGIFAHRGEYEKSVGLYRTVISQYPEDLSTYLNYAEGLLLLKDYDESVKWAEHVLARQPDNYLALRLQGRALFQQRKFKQAAKSMRSLLRYAPDDPTLQLDLSEAQLNSGEWYAGMRTLKKMLDVNPAHPTARQRLNELRRLHSEAFSFDYSHEQQSDNFFKRISKFSFTKAISSLFGMALWVSEENYSSETPGFADTQYRDIGTQVTSYWRPELQTRFGAEARRLGNSWDMAGAGSVLWRFNSFASLNLAADMNALWNDPLMASFFEGRTNRLQSDLNLTLMKNIVIWNRLSYEHHSINEAHFGDALRTYAQAGYQWGLKPYLLTYYQFYNLSYQYQNAANAAIISIPENESVHYLGAAINHQLTRRFYYQFSGSIGMMPRLNTMQYFGTLHLEYTLLRNLRLRTNIAYGSQNTLIGSDKYRSFNVDFFYFY